MKRTTVLFFLVLVSAVTARAQSYAVVSDLPNNGSAAVLSYVGNVTSYHSTVLLGHFSKVGQTADDISTLDANGNFSCLQNNNGTFSAPVVTPATPSGSTPTAVKLFSATDATTATDSIWIAAASTAGSSLIRLTNFVNCVPVVSGGSLPNVAPSVINFFSDVFTSPAVLGIGGTPGNVVLATSSSSQVWMLSSTGGTYANVDDSFFMGGTYAVPGPFNEVACSSCPNYVWAIVTVEPQSSNSPAPFAMVSDTAGSLGRGNFVDLEGQNFLGFIFTPDKNIVAVSATGNQVFFDAVSLITSQPTIQNVGTFTLSANPAGLVRGNFANNTQYSDVAVANGNQIAILTYVGAAGTPAWSLAQTLQASGTIQAVATGSLSSTGNEIVAQIGSNAEVFSTVVSFTELPPPPTPTTYTLTVQVSGNGTVAQNPSGATTFPSGTVITLTATPQTGATFSSWSNACQGTQNICTVTLTSNLSVLATFTTNPTPSLAVAPPSATISAGNSASYAVTPNNFSSTPTLTASCSIPKGSCGISNGQLVITTTASTTIGVLTFDFRPLLPLLVTLLLYVLLIPKQTPKFAFGFLVVVLLLTGCSGGSHVQPAQQIIQGTPSGSYAITVAGTSGSQSATTQATLVVQ